VPRTGTLTRRPAALACLSLLALIALGPRPALAAAPEAAATALVGRLVVIADDSYVFEQPDGTSPILRRLYRGELLLPLEEVTTPWGGLWVRVQLGAGSHGYVRAAQVEPSSDLPREKWTPEIILRDERPLSLALRGGAQGVGAAVAIRYLPFTRLGLTLDIGPVLDRWRPRGTAFSFGLVSLPALWDVSPLFELGLTRLEYRASHSSLAVTAAYLTVGAEWMTSVGLFAGAGATYVRSLDLELTSPLAQARQSGCSADTYGVLDPGEGSVLQRLEPMVSVGYAF
jgi:hypothetical protein